MLVSSIFISFLLLFQADFYAKLSSAAVYRTTQTVSYDGSYFSISYPNGDVPANKGVCTDLVVRSYRALGIDLQKLVHEDMKQTFSEYPNNWGLSAPDRNIDHRRVPNLMKFFSRFGETKPISNNPSDFAVGDIVAWDLGKGVTHIGILVDQKSLDNQRFLVAHNIGRGPEISDCLFDYIIIGHYRYQGE